MKRGGTYTFQAKAEEVWDLLLDPQVLLQIVPGLDTVDIKPNGEIVATAKVGVGPVKGTFSGTLRLLDERRPTHVKVVGEGKGGPGFARGSCILDAVEQDNTTVVNYQADVQIGGPLASVGQRLLDSTTDMMLRQGFDAFQRVLLERKAAMAAVAEAADSEASEEVAEFFPRWAVYGLGIAVALLSLAAYFSHP